jgi:hypothetical protein
MVKGQGIKGKQHDTKLKALLNPTVLTYVGWQIPQFF